MSKSTKGSAGDLGCLAIPHPGHGKSFPAFSAVKGKPDFAHADSVARLANPSTVEAMQLTNLIENEEKRDTF